MCIRDRAKILNGKIIPGDRVFYPVKSHITSSIPKVEKNNLDGKTCMVTYQNEDAERVNSLTSVIEARGGKIIRSDAIDLNPEEKDVDLYIHFTGNIPNFSKLTELSRAEWDKLVDRFIDSTAGFAQNALDELVIEAVSYTHLTLPTNREV